MDITKIGNYIRDKRKELNLTQNELAIKLAVSHQAVSRWEKGDNLPDVEKLSELAELFNITVDQIIRHGKNQSIDVNESNQLSFFSLINGILVFIATILFYILVITTARFWIGYLVQYVLVIGISLIYIIPYSQLQNKKSQDFTYVRYGILSGIASISMTVTLLFFGLYQFILSVAFGALLALILVIIVNLLLVQYQSNFFQLDVSQISKTASKKSNKIISEAFLCVITAVILIAITGFGSDAFTKDPLTDTERVLGLGFGALLLLITSLYTIPSLIRTLKKKYYLNFMYTILFVFGSIFIMYLNVKYLNIEITKQDSITLVNLYFVLFIPLFIMFVVALFTLIISFIKSKENFLDKHKHTIITTVLLIIFFIINSYSLTMTSVVNQYYYTHHYIFEESLIPFSLYISIILYIRLPYIKSGIKKIR